MLYARLQASKQENNSNNIEKIQQQTKKKQKQKNYQQGKTSKQICFELIQAAPQRLCYWTTV